jgi:ABC-2 type transport system permease protein
VINESATSPLKYLKALLPADASVLVKNKRSTILSILLPIVYLVIFDSEKTQQRIGGSLYIVSFSIAVGLTSVSILGYALNVARDRERGVFQRLRITPAPTWTIMISRLLVQTVANLIIAIVVLIVATVLYHLHLGIAEWLFTLLLSIIGGAVFLSIGQALVGFIKSADTINASGRIIFIALLLLGLLGPDGVLGNTIANISKWSPLGTVIAILQSALHQTQWTGQTSLALLACFGYIIIFSFLGIKWFRWESR